MRTAFWPSQMWFAILLVSDLRSQVVECYGIFDHMGEISFVLELMDGGTLADIVKKKVGTFLKGSANDCPLRGTTRNFAQESFFAFWGDV